MSQMRIIDNEVEKLEVETVNSGLLDHLLEQITKLQTELEVILREFLPLNHETTPLPEAIDLDKVLS